VLAERFLFGSFFLNAVADFWGRGGVVHTADPHTYCAACPSCASKSHSDPTRRFPLVVRLEPAGWRLWRSCQCPESAILSELERAAAARGRGSAAGEAEPAAAVASSWAPVDLRALLEGDTAQPAPTVGERSDGHCLFYERGRHAVVAEPESCKGWLAHAAAAQCVRGGRRVLYVDFEGDAETAVERQAALGSEPDALVDALAYVRPTDPLAPGDVEALAALRPALAVLDGVTEGMVLHGLDPLSNVDAARWGELLARPLAAAGAAVAELDHPVKDREQRGRWALGAQHKLASLDAAYRLDVVEPFGRGREGLVRVTVTKDRPGHVRRHAAEGGRVAEMRLASLPGGRVEVRLEPPAAGEGGAFRPTRLMERVSRAVEDEPGLSKSAVRAAVPGNSEAKDLALETLVAEGWLERRREGQAHRHHSVRPYREADDPAPLPEPCPDPAPGRVPDDPAPLPRPTRAGGGVGGGEAARDGGDPAPGEEGA
jgi:hypothetical protein